MAKIPTAGKKLKSQRGEEIAEILFALLISSVGLVMLASMIATSLRLPEVGKQKMEEYVEAENMLATYATPAPKTGEEDKAMNQGFLGTGNVTFSVDGDSSQQIDFTVRYYYNSVINDKPVISYMQR